MAAFVELAKTWSTCTWLYKLKYATGIDLFIFKPTCSSWIFGDVQRYSNGRPKILKPIQQTPNKICILCVLVLIYLPTSPRFISFLNFRTAQNCLYIVYPLLAQYYQHAMYFLLLSQRLGNLPWLIILLRNVSTWCEKQTFTKKKTNKLLNVCTCMYLHVQFKL